MPEVRNVAKIHDAPLGTPEDMAHRLWHMMRAECIVRKLPRITTGAGEGYHLTGLSVASFVRQLWPSLNLKQDDVRALLQPVYQLLREEHHVEVGMGPNNQTRIFVRDRWVRPIPEVIKGRVRTDTEEVVDLSRRTRTKKKPVVYTCEFEGCNQEFRTRRDRTFHMRIHGMRGSTEPIQSRPAPLTVVAEAESQVDPDGPMTIDRAMEFLHEQIAVGDDRILQLEREVRELKAALDEARAIRSGGEDAGDSVITLSLIKESYRKFRDSDITMMHFLSEVEDALTLMDPSLRDDD